MPSPKHARACVWLFIATGFWGLSFPFIKSIWLLQERLVPEAPSIFFAALTAGVRFGVAGIIVALFCVRTLRHLTRLELAQGLGLGFFGGVGILFQMDGLAHTPASTSAFLTQFYCLLIPLWVAWRHRAAPKIAVLVSSMLVLTGVAILARFDGREFKLGRGEAETLLSTVFFAAQILWLERPRYAPNRVSHFTVVMFSSTALLLAPVAMFTAPSASAFVQAYNSSEVLWLVGALTLLCTLGSYTLMNVWQPLVTATEAGLIYCVEPLVTSCLVLFLPGWISRFAGINYANEPLTSHLLIGGGCITLANVLIQIEAMRQRRKLAQGK